MFRRSCFVRLFHRRQYRNRSTSFDQTIDYRISQARRSLLVQANQPNSLNEVIDICSRFGHIHRVFSLNIRKEVSLIEFCSRVDLHRMLRSCNHFQNISRHPVCSRQLYHIGNYHDRAANHDLNLQLIQIVPPKPSAESILESIAEINDTSAQIKNFWMNTKMTEIDVRLRYFVASIVQDAFTSLFSDCICLPFGSNVSHFGRFDCDLDLVFCFEDYRKQVANELGSPTGEFLFLTKKSFLSDRIQAQIYLKILADIIKHFLPECFQVQIILPAKVPIVRFFHRSTGVWCDISMSDFTGSYYMSKLLWTLSRIDTRIAPLFFSIRYWAKQVGITKSNPGPWLSNFQLTLLTIYFFQQLTDPVIPQLCSGIEGSNEVHISNMKTRSNTDSLGDLLAKFFDFYANFSCSPSIVSLYRTPKFTDENHPLMIENPLTPGLCASKNVSAAEFERFRTMCNEAATILSSNNASLVDLFSQKQEPSLCNLENAYPSPVFVSPDVDNEVDYDKIER